ncbi:MAG: hypothetical protein OEM77_07865 [Nitrosopumilus sp.]|nr:hypothetical protein [Nitrosopumilus sp.]MDH3736845.1 hypothetical protein [Nitrosopumilus sp.]MDH3823098.1 hypothetical protein [Nitrosopumilus sp.]MDH3833023.1 hypothetical protein [Nitrosopumilus sp.]
MPENNREGIITKARVSNIMVAARGYCDTKKVNFRRRSEITMNDEKTVIAGILANIKHCLDVKDSSKTWQESQNLMGYRAKCNLHDDINKRLEKVEKTVFIGSSSLDNNTINALKNEIDELTKMLSR